MRLSLKVVHLDSGGSYKLIVKQGLFSHHYVCSEFTVYNVYRKYRLVNVIFGELTLSWELT